MSEAYPDFEITVGGKEVLLQYGKWAVALFRRQQEVDYIAVDLDDDGGTLRIFNNPDIARWFAGYEISEKDGRIARTPMFRDNQLFRNLVGYNPAVIERETPNESEIEMWTEINAADMETGLKELLGE